jgi:hypothetical protein
LAPSRHQAIVVGKPLVGSARPNAPLDRRTSGGMARGMPN